MTGQITISVWLFLLLVGIATLTVQQRILISARAGFYPGITASGDKLKTVSEVEAILRHYANSIAH